MGNLRKDGLTKLKNQTQRAKDSESISDNTAADTETGIKNSEIISLEHINASLISQANEGDKVSLKLRGQIFEVLLNRQIIGDVPRSYPFFSGRTQCTGEIVSIRIDADPEVLIRVFL